MDWMVYCSKARCVLDGQQVSAYNRLQSDCLCIQGRTSSMFVISYVIISSLFCTVSWHKEEQALCEVIFTSIRDLKVSGTFKGFWIVSCFWTDCVTYNSCIVQWVSCCVFPLMSIILIENKYDQSLWLYTLDWPNAVTITVIQYEADIQCTFSAI